jgi:hypothetical protein
LKKNPNFNKTKTFKAGSTTNMINSHLMRTSHLLTVILLEILCARGALAQDPGSFNLGWKGEEIIPAQDFIDAGRWIPNAQSGNSISLFPNDSCLQLKWFIDAGNYRWVQAYRIFNPAVSLGDLNVFALDIHGSSCPDQDPCHQNVSLEFKFENGSRQAVYERRGEPGLLSVGRWIEHLFFLRNSENFYIPAGFNWDSITVFSVAVRSYPDYLNITPDSGVVSFRNFIGDNTDTWERSEAPERLALAGDTLTEIADRAASFILGRQAATGLLTTWEEDHSSWLYGQGLALKALVLEGAWENNLPVNDNAVAARKLAWFLSDHQYEDGSWPRAWNSSTGSIIVPHESDGTIWMGDFPFILMGLEATLKKACDTKIQMARDKAREFLLALVEPDGKFYTVNRITGGKQEVTSSEAYVAAIAALLETGDETEAGAMISYLETRTWNPHFRSWDEGFYSDRVVLFANTWMANLLYSRGYSRKALDALSLAGRLMFTAGPGGPYGFDGIGPIAVWYEGTLSYINAGGPGSNFLFRNIIPSINPDGSVPHYNDDIGANAGIWAERWASLDGTSWLYYTARGCSPFEPLEREAVCDTVSVKDHGSSLSGVTVFPNPANSFVFIQFPSALQENTRVSVRDISGRILLTEEVPAFQHSASLDIAGLSPGICFIDLGLNEGMITRKLAVQ